jgi:hypothetical protein
VQKCGILLGRPLNEAIIRRPLTVEFRTQFRIGPCVFCGGQVDIGTGFCGSISIFPSNYHSNNASAEILQVYLSITGNSFHVWKRVSFVKLCGIFPTYVEFRLCVLRPECFRGQVSSGDAGLQHYRDNSLH